MIDFTLSDTQQQLLGTARDFGKEVLGPAEIALDKLADPQAVFEDERYWDALKQSFELGFHKMTINEHFGGLGLDASTTGLVWEELGRWAPGFAASLIAGAAVPAIVGFLAGHNETLVEQFVTPYVEDTTGKGLTAWGSSEPNIGSDGKNYHDPDVHHSTRAELKDGRYLLSGTKSNFVSNGGIARAYLMFACMQPELGICGSGAFLVPADAPGVEPSKAVDRLGMRVLNQAPVFMDGVELPEENMIFPSGEGFPFLHNSIITVGNLGTGYLALGLMRAAYEEAMEYARERVQWGKPIVEHQLVARKLFEIHAAIESCRALLWKGSWYSTNQFPGDLKTSLTAKIWTSELACKHTAEMVQVLGGYGLTRDYNLEKYMRDAQMLKVMDGTNDTLMLKAAGLLAESA